MKSKQRLLGVCTILIIILVLIAPECDALKSSSSRKTSSGRGKSSSSGNSGSNSGSWWSRGTGGGSSSSSSASKVSSTSVNTHKKPEPSAPRYEEKKPIGWNVPGASNPAAPPAYSNTHTRGLSNPSLQQNPPPYSKNNPPGHQTIQSNNNPNQQYSGYPVQSNVPNQYQQGLNYQRNTGQQYSGYPVQSNVPNQYQQGLNYPRNTGPQYSGYPGGSYPSQGGHYPGMNYGGGGYSGHSGYSPVQTGYFASGYPVGNSNYGGRSSSGSTLTNALLAGTVGLGLYNAIRPYPSYPSGGSYGGAYGGGSGATVHNHYYNNNQGVGANPDGVQTPAQVAPAQAAPAQAIPPNQNTNAVQTPLAPMPQTNSSAVDSTAALVTPPPPTLAPNDQITDKDCVYAMKILNCSEISQCPQEWLHPSCLNRTISKEYYDSIELPPPPPMPQAQPETNLDASGKASDLTSIGQNKNENRDQSVHSSNNQQQLPVVSSSNSSSKAVNIDYSLCLTIFLGIVTLKNKF